MINQSNTDEVKNRVGSKSCHNNARIDTLKEEAHTNFSYENQTCHTYLHFGGRYRISIFVCIPTTCF